MLKFIKSSLSLKIGATLITFVFIILITGILVIQSVFSDMSKQNALNEAEHQLAFAEDLMTIQDEQIRKHALTYGKVFSDRFNMELFSIDNENMVTVGSADTPSFFYNGHLINNNTSIPDNFTKITGAVATIFVKTTNQDGNADFVRVTTSLKKEDGESRAMGTYLGSAHPAYNDMINNKPFVGLAQLFGRNYATSYIPIYNNGEVMGILFVGIDFTCELANLIQTIQHKKIGKSGYFFVLNTKEGDKKGRPVIHPALDKNKDISAEKAEAAEFFPEMMEKGSGTIEYAWANEEMGESSPRDKTMIYSSFAPWNWMVAASIYEDDINEQANKIRLVLVLVLVVISVTVITVLSYTLKKLLSKPMGKMVGMTKTIAGGDLRSDRSEEILSNDEIGTLAASFRDMAVNLSGMVSRLQQSGHKLNHSADEFSGTVNILTDKIGQHKDHIQQIASSAAELSATTSDISSNLSRNAEDVDKTLRQAKDGEKLIDSSKNSTYAIADIVSSTTQMVTVLGDKSNEIGNIINVISDIADQTNLLALNAAIEAARAGEHGRGFAVVADEVRKLAEKTAQSTSEIGSMVAEIQTAVKQAVESMSAVNSKVSENVHSAEAISEFLGNLVNQMNLFNDSFQHLAASTEEMATTSEAISGNLEGIALFSEELEDVAAKIDSGASVLSGEATEIEKELSVFKI